MSQKYLTVSFFREIKITEERRLHGGTWRVRKDKITKCMCNLDRERRRNKVFLGEEKVDCWKSVGTNRDRSDIRIIFNTHACVFNVNCCSLMPERVISLITDTIFFLFLFVIRNILSSRGYRLARTFAFYRQLENVAPYKSGRISRTLTVLHQGPRYDECPYW